MIATGTDVKPLEVLIFMRDVQLGDLLRADEGPRRAHHSRHRFDKRDARCRGKDPLRADRRGGRDRECKTTSRPLERKRWISFDKLIDGVAQGDRSEDSISSLGARLAALDRAIDDKDRKRITEASGGLSLTNLARRLVDAVDADVIEAKAREQHPPPISEVQLHTFRGGQGNCGAPVR